MRGSMSPTDTKVLMDALAMGLKTGRRFLAWPEGCPVAREASPEYPGVFDLAVWDIGRKWCRPQRPAWGICPMGDLCPSTRPAGP